MYGIGSQKLFLDYVQGTLGSFTTPAGRVDYIMTKARLGEDANDPERRLTKSLAPVREVMEAGDLDFNQLLQRDLDDFRVSAKLIPYLLTQKATGPAFFPPVVAALLPFKNKRPSQFPEVSGTSALVQEDGASWVQEDAGQAFRVQRLAGPDGRPHPGSVGKLWWNSSETRLVVLDGQHRAMALLAVERTMTRSWQGSSGAKYRSFYENQVQQLLDQHGDLDLNKIEVPVTVCWFPEETGEAGKPHEAARKLFVDVNKEARPPSESRIILLSDAELKNVLTRRLLSELRNQSERFLPIYAVEYDNPDANSSRPARWCVLTNINIFKSIVERTIFGPQRHLIELNSKNVGRPNLREQDKSLRTQLDFATLFSDQFEDNGFTYQREDIGNTYFPLGKADEISDRFAETWGRAILTLLSQVAPYAAHAKALTALKEGWHIDDSSLTLAHDALFGGVGVFWTLRDSYEDFKEKRADGKNPAKSDVILAWESLDNRQAMFEQLRTKEYLDSLTAANAKKAKDAFAVFNTHACQLGLAITLGSLWEIRKQQFPGQVDIKELPDFAEALVRGWNAFFEEGSGRARDRKFAFSRNNITNPLNQIATMDAMQSVYFRYFWLQALDTPAAWQEVAPWFADRKDFTLWVQSARAFYLEFLVNQQKSALKKSQPALSDAEAKKEAEKLSIAGLKKALRDWFFVEETQFDFWVASELTAKAEETEDASFTEAKDS